MEVKAKVGKLGSITSLVPMPHIVFTADTVIFGTAKCPLQLY